MKNEFEKDSRSMYGLTIIPSSIIENNQTADIHQQSYLLKTIEIKNKNIDDLLKELKQAKQLYSEYKNQYINEERKLKMKVSDLTARLDVQVSQVQKLKAMNNKMRGDLQTVRQKQQRLIQSHTKEMKQRTSTLNSLEQKYNDMKTQNNSLREKHQFLINKCCYAQQKNKKLQMQASQYKLQLNNIQQQMTVQGKKWQQQKRELTKRDIEKEKKKNQKVKMNDKLNQIENKIKDTLRKI